VANDLVVNLSGNNSKLKSSLKESKSALASFGESAKSFIKPAKAAFAGVAVGAAAAGVAIYAVANRISSLAGIADEAVKTGLSGAFLQRLGYAADQSGVNVETLTGGIKKLTIAIGNADSKPFEKLGVDFQKLKTLQPEQQFMMIAAAIGKLPTAAERAAASVAIFGKSGVDMANLFAGGMGELNTLLKDAEALGIGISPEGLAKAAAADDAIQRMKASFGALFDQVTVGLAPAFNEVATAIANMIPPITQFIDKFNNLGDMNVKIKFIGELFDASFNVAIESIKANWMKMLDFMLSEGIKFAIKNAKNLVSYASPGALIASKIMDSQMRPNVEGQTRLETAKLDFQNVLSQLDKPQLPPVEAFNPALAQGPAALPSDPTKLTSLASGIAEGVGGMFDQISLAATSKLTDLKIKGGFLGASIERMFSGEKTKAVKPEVTKAAGREIASTAGGMARGSAEAFSTIVKAMMGNRDPNVIATQKQTVALTKAIKENKPQQFTTVGAFA
jgi:hypothetical protein